MTNPNNAVGTNAAYGGRTSVNAFNDDLTIYSRGILSGWACSPKSGMTVQIGGNGYLSVYITGIILGNLRLHNKKALVHFFDGVTSLSQILVFSLIGLLSYPSQMPKIIPTALLIVAILTFVARPFAVSLLMMPCKCSLRQCILISWAGLRGASSCVFAIMAVASGIRMKQDLFHIVFMVTLFSVAFQGGLLPMISGKLKMVDSKADVRKTFTDYQELPV